ncbi:MAG: hypothetical protein BAJALOKI2v1_540012 [Promethearchaeota archaeon]|nr:MAG: hypothetical protein BAJALOKI2v1_540012 [Candidatus Lokiarchaeota archaeon]
MADTKDSDYLDEIENMEDMNGLTFKKDEKPYLVFPCMKCGYYTYAKLSQRGKKCFRCGRNHQITKIRNLGEIVHGMSNAVETVKEKQNELAREELGNDPEFRSKKSFRKRLTPAFESQNSENSEGSKTEGGYEKFKNKLRNKTKHFAEFPGYVIQLIAEKCGLSRQEERQYILKLREEGFLKPIGGDMYKIIRE